jgi:hypothetical protein
MPGVTSSQGSTVTFDGSELGSLLSIAVQSQASSPVDVTYMGSAIVGSGSDARMVREVTVLSIEPTTVEVSFLGASGYGTTDPGNRGTLVIAGGVGLNAAAILTGYGETVAVGEYVKGSASFVLTGT